MLFDPGILVREPIALLAVVLVILIGKGVAAFAVVLALGYPPSVGLSVSASLAQIGEFSFILAGLGVSIGVLPPEGRDLVLAGALLSITLNPVAFVASDRILAACSASRRVGGWFSTYGQQKHMALQAELAALVKRMEERAAERRVQIRQLVGRFPVFADLPPQAWEELLLLLRHQTASPGERIIRTGDRSQAVYFIEFRRRGSDCRRSSHPLGRRELFWRDGDVDWPATFGGCHGGGLLQAVGIGTAGNPITSAALSAAAGNTAGDGSTAGRDESGEARVPDRLSAGAPTGLGHRC